MGEEKLTRKVYEAKEGGKSKNVVERSEKSIWGKRRKMGERKENVQRQKKVETIMEKGPIKLNSALPYTSRLHGF